MKDVASLLRSKGVGVHCIQRRASVEDAIREFLARDVSSLAVCDGERLVGIFTKNDLVRILASHPDDPRKLRVEEGMQEDVFTTAPQADLEEVMCTMVKRNFRHVPVLDGGKPVGMVTAIDVLTHQREVLRVERDELVRYIRGSY